MAANENTITEIKYKYQVYIKYVFGRYILENNNNNNK